jgi:hypothetical protein
MKKLIFSLALVATGVASYAQISQGSLMIGGSLGFSSNDGGKITNTPAGGGASVSTDRTAKTEWNLSPTIGYFLTDNIAAGVRLNIGSSNEGQATSTDLKTTENVNSMNLGVELFGRMYKSVGSNLYLYADLGLGYQSKSYTDRDADPNDPAKLVDGSKNTISGLMVGLTPGIAYFPADNWAIDFNLNRILGFSSMTMKEEFPQNGGNNESTDTDFGVGIGLTPTIGVHYFFGK